MLATSDVPGGVVNILTGRRDELAPHLASHLDVDALDLDAGDAELERAAADNVKRVVRDRGDAQSPYEISSFLELKTVWHPDGAVARRAGLLVAVVLLGLNLRTVVASLPPLLDGIRADLGLWAPPRGCSPRCRCCASARSRRSCRGSCGGSRSSGCWSAARC